LINSVLAGHGPITPCSGAIGNLIIKIQWQIKTNVDCVGFLQSICKKSNMAKEKKITTTFEATNIGPHRNLSDSLQFSSLKIGVFGNNGSGKTFLSRMFRLIDNPDIEKANKILSINTTSGSFSFQIGEMNDTGDVSDKLEIKISKDNKPIIVNRTKYIFHVFNSDYVNDNIAEKEYLPDGEIEGYILGKAKIDLSKEKAQLQKLDKKIKDKVEVFKEEVDKAKIDLDKVKVSKNTKEYKFDYKDVYHNTSAYTDEKSFDDLKSVNSVLSKMPDDLPDVSEIEINADASFIDGLSVLFNTEYSKSSFAQEFKEKIEKKQEFIIYGIKKLPKDRNDWENCPFCEQELLEDAKKLIDDYVAFISDEEARVKADINRLISGLENLEKDLNSDFANLAKISRQFENIKQYIPSEASVILDEFAEDEKIKQSISSLKDLLARKRNDIEKVIEPSEYENEIKIISDYIESIKKTGGANNNLISELNAKKKNTREEKLRLNRRLCKARYQKLQIDLKDSIDEIKALHEEKKEREKDIEEKESQEKVSKKSKVIKSLEYYLSWFFGDKYTFDKENFCLKFHNHLMDKNSTDILSDGEKNIVAFCFYLSDLHKIISKETDYENLFFIIDDPISSLDFHYVYSVSQVLKDLEKQLGVKKSKFLIFTHNLEFMSILTRNRLIKKPVILSNSKLSPLSRELVMPYEEHLRDINSVSKGDKPPSHTTPNSVRHVLETINRFEAPNLNLREYCEKNSVLEKNEFVYSLMHDGSHGIIRQQKAYTDEMMKEGCKAVIDFVKKKFEGQIKQIESK